MATSTVLTRQATPLTEITTTVTMENKATKTLAKRRARYGIERKRDKGKNELFEYVAYGRIDDNGHCPPILPPIRSSCSYQIATHSSKSMRTSILFDDIMHRTTMKVLKVLKTNSISNYYQDRWNFDMITSDMYHLPPYESLIITFSSSISCV